MTEIIAEIDELLLLEKSIKEMNKQRKELIMRKKILHSSILNFIENSNHNNIKFKSYILKKINQNVRKKLNEEEKKQELNDLFSKFSIKSNDISMIIEKIKDINKGELAEISRLKLVEYK